MDCVDRYGRRAGPVTVHVFVDETKHRDYIVGRVLRRGSPSRELAILVDIIEAILLPMVKVMVSLPEDLLVQIDAEVERRSTTRSAFLANAARRELVRRDRADVVAAIERSEQRFRHAGSFESGDLVRSDRDDRP